MCKNNNPQFIGCQADTPDAFCEARAPITNNYSQKEVVRYDLHAIFEGNFVAGWRRFFIISGDASSKAYRCVRQRDVYDTERSPAPPITCNAIYDFRYGEEQYGSFEDVAHT
jgi:hypothetical protein